MRLLCFATVALCIPAVASAWTTPTTIIKNNPEIRRTNNNDRRAFLTTTASALVGLSLPLQLQPQPANAAASPKEAAIFDKFSVEDAKNRFLLARKEMQYLLDNYSDITKKGGGDAIRNYLGTQGVTSNMYGIQKVLKLLQQESEDIVEYTETMDEFNAYYYQAEGAAYQSMFAEHSSAKVTPEQLLVTAKKDIESMVKYMDQLAVQLNL